MQIWENQTFQRAAKQNLEHDEFHGCNNLKVICIAPIKTNIDFAHERLEGAFSLGTFFSAPCRGHVLHHPGVVGQLT